MTWQKISSLALDYGRSLQSTMTGLIHMHRSDEKSRDAIPILENFYFTLALFRTHQCDLVKEGCQILERLLHWQVQTAQNLGGFPRYMHEYPTNTSAVDSLHILVILYWLEVEYSKVIHRELRFRLEKCKGRLYKYCCKSHSKKPYSQGNLLMMMALENTLDETFFRACTLVPKNSEDCGKFLLATQILLHRGQKTYGERLFSAVLTCWSQELSTYIGSLDERYHSGHAPRGSLLDYFMAHYFENCPRDLLKPNPIHIQTAAIFSWKKWGDKLCNPQEPHLPFENCIFQIHQSPYNINKPPQGFHLLALLWKEGELLYSFVCQNKNFEAQPLGNHEHFAIALQKCEQNADNLTFYLSAHPKTSILVNEQKATVFFAGDKLSIVSPNSQCDMSFESIAGNTPVLGHISYGNRPAQQSMDRFTAYDWKISLRNLAGDERVKILLRLKIKTATPDYQWLSP